MYLRCPVVASGFYTQLDREGAERKKGGIGIRDGEKEKRIYAIPSSPALSLHPADSMATTQVVEETTRILLK